MQQNRAVIDLGAVRANAALLRSRAAGAKFCAVVKADAYGHGAAMVAVALRGIADCFAVALVEEGARLRAAGVAADILVLVPPLCEEEVLRGCAHGLIFSVGGRADLALIAGACERFGVTARVHWKVNTGMNRFGFDMPAFRELCRSPLPACVRAEGVYSHLYAPHSAPRTRDQLARFGDFCAAAEGAFGPLAKHIAATGGVLAGEGCCLDMVRVGIGLYGYVPQGVAPAAGLRPAMRVYTTVAAARRYEYGGMGYREERPAGERLSVLRCGYADGFFRSGALCMDAAVVEADRAQYEEVCILSDAEAYARRQGTISYEVLVRAGTRAIRQYVTG